MDQVVFKNPHVPHIFGRLDPTHFTPFSKNPVICNFMPHIGRYEQAGSGAHNVNKYLPHYTLGAIPLFVEYSDTFSAIIPLTGKDTTPELVSLLLAMEGDWKSCERWH